MRKTFWKRMQRRMRRALVRARRAAAPAGWDETIIHGTGKNACTDLHVETLHVLTSKFLQTQENITPDFEFFDLTRTTAPTDSNNAHTNHVGGGTKPMADAHEVLREKTKFCAFVSSNPFCATRNRLLEILGHYHRVDSAGPALPNRPIVPRPSSRTIEFYRPYKFVLAFENSLALDYASEKLWFALRARTVPIYWGNPQIAKYHNPERFINAFDFDTLESLARHVMRVHEDDALYLRYLAQPSRTPRQEHPRFQRYGNFERARIYLDQVEKNRKRLASGRTLPLGQRRMFHRECLSRFEPDDCFTMAKDRLRLAGWQRRGNVSGRVSIAGRQHVWPHSAFYGHVDMTGQLSVKAS